MADVGFKFSRLGEGEPAVDQDERHGGDRDIFDRDPEDRSPAETDMGIKADVIVTSGVRDIVGPVKAVKRTTLLLMALVAVLCLLSIVLSGLALSKVMALSPPADKVWTFAIGNSNLNLHYVDQLTTEMEGFDVDMVNAVCMGAGKVCRVVTDVYSNCWKSQKGDMARGGDGLMGGWYDACIGWSQTLERRRTFAFTEPYTKPLESAFFVLRSTPKGTFDSTDFLGKRIGFLDGYADDEHCLNRQSSIKNVPLQVNQIYHFSALEGAENALKNRTIDAVFTTRHVAWSDDVVEVTPSRPFNCTTRGLSVMTRMDSGLEVWWNAAWNRVWNSKSYHLICQTLEVRHGRFPSLRYQDICLHV